MLTQFIHSGSLRLATLESSARSPRVVLMCHGNSTSAEIFSPLFECSLARDIRLIAFSLPGHGSSDRCKDTAGYSIRSLVRLVADVSEGIAAERLILCGHSLGGHLMLEALPLLPRLSGLMLISSPPLSLSTLDRTFKPDPTRGSLFARSLDEGQVSAFARSIVHPGHVSPERFDGIVRSVRSTDGEFRPALGRSLTAGEFGDEQEILRDASVPIAMLGGADDPFIHREAYATTSSASLWRGKPIVLASAGHSPHLEAPGEFLQIFTEFVSSV